jgi:hypothetical protein
MSRGDRTVTERAACISRVQGVTTACIGEVQKITWQGGARQGEVQTQTNFGGLPVLTAWKKPQATMAHANR